jgi:hypothetical protein
LETKAIEHLEASLGGGDLEGGGDDGEDGYHMVYKNQVEIVADLGMG